MRAGSSAIRSKQGQHVGRTPWPERAKGHHVATAPCSLLSPPNSKLKVKNMSPYPKRSGSRSNSSWTAEPFVLGVIKGMTGVWQGTEDELSYCWPVTCELLTQGTSFKLENL